MYVDLKCEFYKNFLIYTKILWKYVHEYVGTHANSDHHRSSHTYLIVR